MAYDAETFFDDMTGLIDAAAINAKTTALNTEKGDSALKTDFTDADHFILNFNEKVINLDEFIHYGFIDVETLESNATKVAETFKMFFIIWIICVDDEILEMRKLLRYTRALEEIAKEAALNFKTSILEVETFKPVTVENDNGSNWYRAAGIHVTGVIA